mmetsp:Transcript_14752/g.2447  ORF Transcript_14752/g.2447 Transcript_14752/m.2447 type:complete len:114 (-) Transcript_14752:913-1254(-)
MQPIEWKASFIGKFEQLSLLNLINFGQRLEGQEGNSDLFTFISLLKSMLASGILYIPRGFFFGGWLFSVLVFTCLGFFSTISMIWLSRVRDHIKGGYVEIAEIVLGKAGKVIA